MISLKQKISKYYINYRGWSTKRKLLLIESDDWGSIRMRSQKSFDNLIKKGYKVDQNKFTSLDGLESQDDLENLFSLLKLHKDFNGNNPVITALSLVANPDFKKIQESNFTKYFFESIEKTYIKYGELTLLDFWKKEGINNNLLYPQFHGREHLNPKKWLRVLNQEYKIEKDAFNENVLLGLYSRREDENRNYMAGFEHTSEDHKHEICKIVIEGLNLFEQIFGFRSLSFMPSQSIQFQDLNKVLVNEGVKFNQGGQFFSAKKDGSFKQFDKIWGFHDDFGMRYWRRNCTFEPYKDQNKEHISDCLKEIEIAFKCGKPAVINSHRINFTSRINKNHRDQSLEKLNKLLEKVLLKWPNVEFVNSEQLSNIIIDSLNP